MNSKFSLEDLLSRRDRGTEAWWQAVAQQGTPLQRELANGEIQLSFLWRDPEGSAAQSDYQRVYLDIYSHTPHPTEQLTSMDRLGDSDIWFWQTQLPGDWCGSYFLMPAKSHQLPPADDRKAIRRWWIGLMATNAQADALNPLPGHNNGSGVALSRIELPQANIHPLWQIPIADHQGHLQSLRWCSESLHNARDIWVYSTASSTEQADLPLVIMLDGHYWARHMPIFSHLDGFTASGELAPAVYIFVDAINHSIRAEELTCNADFWLALQGELLPQVFALQAFTHNPARTLVVGQSFGGLAALYAALHWPERFAAVLSQSGSFWWPDTSAAAAEGLLTGDVLAGLGREKNLHITLQVGCYETDMLGVNRAMRAALEIGGHRISYREFRGGHDWICWRHELVSGLSQFFHSIPEGSNPA
ncbi:MAG TPA: enterochelin esterase [Cellvibrio sp.]|nr:enterochelin esterase [Cellvibrio sp.]